MVVGIFPRRRRGNDCTRHVALCRRGKYPLCPSRVGPAVKEVRSAESAQGNVEDRVNRVDHVGCDVADSAWATYAEALEFKTEEVLAWI